MKSEAEQKEILDTYTFNDYKKVFHNAISEAGKMADGDERLNKWLIRTLVQEKLYYETELTEKQAVHLAKNAMDEDKAWKTIAKQKYGVTATEEEVDQFIKAGPDQSDLPKHLAYADALGLSLAQLNHQFDRDLYEKNVMWLKLKPKLEKKYGVSSNNALVEKYESEVKKKVN
ncbi:hypothetical protein P8610_05490 [Fictibacillus sp. UD]|uniref:hypothetical protein n=1 Tax=Fictibacillus sp. UD TaxID=3038777 RepID=UPI003746B50B